MAERIKSPGRPELRGETRGNLRGAPAAAPVTASPACACGGACPRCQEEAPGLPFQAKTVGPLIEADSAPMPPGSGAPMDPDLREAMERHFGANLGDVRIHTGSAAAQGAGRIGARAMTAGSDIYFGRGQYAPGTRSGMRLLAHEVTHVLQQRRGRFPLSESHPEPASAREQLEDEADARAEAFQVTDRARPVEGRADRGRPQFDLLEDARTAVSGSINTVADWVIRRIGAAQDAIMRRLVSLRRRLRGRTTIPLRRGARRELEGIYRRLRAAAPSWVPVPNLSFRGLGAQLVAGVDDIAVLILLLILALAIVMWWIATNSIPSIRRQRERDMRRLIEIIEEGLTPPLPLQGNPPDTAPPDVFPWPPPAVPEDVPVPDTDAPPVPDTDAPPVPDEAPEPDERPRPGPVDPPPPPPPPPPRPRRRRKPLRWLDYLRHRVTLNSGGRRGALDFRYFRVGGRTSYDHDFDLGGRRYRLRSTTGLEFHGHHAWPKQFGGPDRQRLMAVRGALHLGVLHPALLAYLRALGHDLTVHTTDARNQRFIARLRSEPAFRARVRGELIAFYALVNSITDPQMPSDAYQRGIDDGFQDLGGP